MVAFKKGGYFKKLKKNQTAPLFQIKFASQIWKITCIFIANFLH